MKKLLPLLLTAALLTLSACNGAGEGQVIDLTESSSQVSEAVDISSESSTSPEIYAHWQDDLPLKLITDIVPVWVSHEEDAVTKYVYEEGSAEWYHMKYISPYIVPSLPDMDSSSDISVGKVISFFLCNIRAHIEPDNYVNYELDKLVIPAEIIEDFAYAYFGIDEYNHTESEFYYLDGNYYLLPFPAFGSGPWTGKLKKAEVDGNIITIYIDIYDDEYYTNYVKSTTYTIEDNGDTFRYLSVKTYVGEEKLNDFEEIINNAPAPDDTEEATTTSLVFPNGEAGKNENNAAIFDTAPFEVTMSMPAGWTFGKAANSDKFTLMPVFTKTEIINQEGIVVGVIGFNVCEQYEGAEDEPKVIYNQISLGNDYKFNVRDEYNIVNERPNGNTALTNVEYAASINDGEEKTNIGIVSYNRDKLVYIAIELFSKMADKEQAEIIAKSIVF